VANVLASKRARIISINKGEIHPKLTISDHCDKEYEIWFEHECAIEDSWRESVTHQASQKWMERNNASVPKSG
jgi:hypothetical protein